MSPHTLRVSGDGKATELTQKVLDESSGYTVTGAKHEEDPLVLLKRALEGIAELL